MREAGQVRGANVGGGTQGVVARTEAFARGRATKAAESGRRGGAGAVMTGGVSRFGEEGRA